ncbi:MAG: type IV secretory system conjugative DNA transfer family protein, partial [Hespellia sp.]|nr:type IV secretory system conjugative DNA transfer family protein [Hespellia sp.]
MRNMTKRMLAEGVSVSNDTWQTGLNNNDLIIGTSGTGKTRGYLLPNVLMAENESMIITDTKGTLKDELSEKLKRKGYQVKCVDFTDCMNSCGYNPFDNIRFDKKRDCHVEQDILKIAACIVPIENYKDPFWDLAARQYLEAVIGYVLSCLPIREHNLTYVYKLFCEMSTGNFYKLMDEMEALEPDSFAVQQYRLFRGTKTAEKMDASIKGVVGEKLELFSFDGAKKLFTNPKKIHFEDLRKEKTVVFLNVSDT